MGGPFRAIVGGAKQTMTFAPAEVIELNNYSTQYGHLVQSDVFVAPGQIGMRILVGGITQEIFEFVAPPGATQAAATAGQICLIRTYEEEKRPGAVPLQPAVGVLLPIGLDQPQHYHSHSHGSHFHSHAHGTHAHDISAASHFHTHAATHVHGHAAQHQHVVSIQVGVIANALGLDAAGNLVAGVAGSVSTNFVAPGNTDAAAPGNTDTTNFGSTALASVPSDSTPTTPATDTTLENVQHTHP